MLALPWAAAALSGRDHYGIEVAGPLPSIPLLQRESMRARGVAATFVFFGFHDCTASCPAQLVNMRRLSDHIQRDDVRFLYISLAPSRIDPVKLERWMQHLGTGFRAFRPADAARARQLLLSMGGFSSPRAKGLLRFEHSSDLYLVSRDHRVLRYAGTALDLDRIGQDLDSLINGS